MLYIPKKLCVEKHCLFFVFLVGFQQGCTKVSSTAAHTRKPAEHSYYCKYAQELVQTLFECSHSRITCTVEPW